MAKAKITKFQHNSPGFAATLKSDTIRALLQTRADAVRKIVEAKYRSRYPEENIRVVADTYRGRTRAGATIIALHPAALRIEQKRRILGSSIGAAR